MTHKEKTKGLSKEVVIRNSDSIREIIEQEIIIKEKDGYKLISEERTISENEGNDSTKLTFTLWTIPQKKYIDETIGNLNNITTPEQFLIITDFHYPYEDEKLIYRVLQCAIKNKIKKCIILGDVMDMEWLSRHPRNISQMDVNEINETAKRASNMLKYIAKRFETTLLLGNHDERVCRNIIGENIASKGIKTPDGYEFYSIGTYLGVNNLMTILPYGETIVINNVVFAHGDQHNMVISPKDIKYSYVYGHVHKTQTIVNNSVDANGTKKLCEHHRVGCLIDMKNKSIPKINSRIMETWNNGFAVLSGSSIENVSIDYDGRFTFRGMEYVNKND